MTQENNNQHISPEEKVYMLMRMDKSRRRWRLFAILFLIISVFCYFKMGDVSKDTVKLKSDYIAEIKIEGIILEDDYRLDRLEELKNDKHAKAVILTIDSPGGAMVPGLELLDILTEIQKVKPLVIQMKTIAASAGFMISLAGEYVVANKATLTGSVGVLMPLVDATELAKKVGIKSAEITSGDLKSITSPINKRSNKAEKYLQETVNDLQDIFMAEVKLRRKVSKEVEDKISDGRVIIGQQALEYRLIDSLGGKSQLLGYLHAQKDISKKLPVKDFSLEEPEDKSFQNILADRLVSGLSTKLDMLLFSSISTPKMIAK